MKLERATQKLSQLEEDLESQRKESKDLRQKLFKKEEEFKAEKQKATAELQALVSELEDKLKEKEDSVSIYTKLKKCTYHLLRQKQ